MFTWQDFQKNFESDLLNKTLRTVHVVNIRADRVASLHNGTSSKKATVAHNDIDDIYCHRTNESFHQTFANFGFVISNHRAIHSTFGTYTGDTLSTFERGLYLDYLCRLLLLIEQISTKFEIQEIDDGNPLYFRLLSAHNNHLILSNRIEFEQQSVSKHGSRKFAQVYAADLPYIDFFYTKNRQFPWQRRSTVTDNQKFSFPCMGQPFPSDITGVFENHSKTKLLDWYTREKNWGINLSVLLSSYDPRIHAGFQGCRQQKELQKSLSAEPSEFIERLMSIPYPVYRFTFTQAMLQWYYATEPYNLTLSTLLTNPLPQLLPLVGRLPSPGFPHPDHLPEEISVSSIDQLMSDAFYLALTSCVSAYLGTEAITQDAILSTLETPIFLNTYSDIIYRLICKEISAYYLCAPDYSAHLPLILLPSYNLHANALMDTLQVKSRLSNIHAMAYTSVQKLCYQQSLKLVQKQ